MNQPPLFAVSDATTSHDRLIQFSLVNLADPSQSRIVEKIAGGHSGLAVSLSATLQAEIQNWVDQLNASGNVPPPAPVLAATFSSIHALILVPKCLSCHNPNGVRPSEDYTDYSSTLQTGGIAVGNASGSELYSECASGSMPENAPSLSATELAALRDWINAGALNN